ncbi:MAG: ARMT1-like domain-containing protein [Bacteroidales bacterium]
MNSSCVFCFISGFGKLLNELHYSEEKKVSILQELFARLSRMNLMEPAPYIAGEIHKHFRELLQNDDPYKERKEFYNHRVMERYSYYRNFIDTAKNPLFTAMKLAVAGNIIDYGPTDTFSLEDTVKEVLLKNYAIDHSSNLITSIKKANKILYIGDNAGEIVFDKLCIETIKQQSSAHIVFVVRHSPVINDCTLKDAEYVKMQDVAHVITSGNDIPSINLSTSSQDFLQQYNYADVIIAKGQGNFEGMYNLNDSRLFFLMMVKCDTIAKILNLKKGDFTIVNKQLLM